ncbi:MAG: GNAT family N-acetyltransferase [Pontixanthobacter sp.]
MIDDVDRMMDIMASAFDPAFGEAWNRRQLSDSIVLPTISYFLVNPHGDICAAQDEPAGFALTRAAPGEEELLLVAVKQQFRRLGLGRILLDMFQASAASRGAERILLEMRANNPAEALYRKFGFEPIGQRKDYYRMVDGSRIDAITFGKTL